MVKVFILYIQNKNQIQMNQTHKISFIKGLNGWNWLIEQDFMKMMFFMY